MSEPTPTPTPTDRALARQQTDDSLDAGIDRMRRFLDAGEGDTIDERRLVAYLDEREARVTRAARAEALAHDLEAALIAGNKADAHEAAKCATREGLTQEVCDRLWSSETPIEWRQVDGDMDPGAHGGTIARVDEEAREIELRRIDPVIACVGTGEAAEVGHPFWTREATFGFDELTPGPGQHVDLHTALDSCGWEYQGNTGSPTDPRILQRFTGDVVAQGAQARMVAAVALLNYGAGDEGPSGWAHDVVPGLVQWSSGDIAGPEYLAEEDAEFRREVLGEDDGEEE